MAQKYTNKITAVLLRCHFSTVRNLRKHKLCQFQANQMKSKRQTWCIISKNILLCVSVQTLYLCVYVSLCLCVCQIQRARATQHVRFWSVTLLCGAFAWYLRAFGAFKFGSKFLSFFLHCRLYRAQKSLSVSCHTPSSDCEPKLFGGRYQIESDPSWLHGTKAKATVTGSLSWYLVHFHHLPQQTAQPLCVAINLMWAKNRFGVDKMCTLLNGRKMILISRLHPPPTHRPHPSGHWSLLDSSHSI